MTQQQQGIIDVFNEEPSILKSPIEYIENELTLDEDEYGDIIRLLGNVSINQDIPEDDIGGYIEDYVSMNLEISIEGLKYNIYCGYDTSHFFEHLDSKVGDFIAPDLLAFGFERDKYRSNDDTDAGCDFSYKCYSPSRAIKAYELLYSKLEYLTVNKEGKCSYE